MPTSGSKLETYPLAAGCEARRRHFSEIVHGCNGGCLQGFGINVNGEYITHLRFADDIVVMVATMEDLSSMLDDLSRASERKGLQMNMDKTKVMANAHVAPTPIKI